ncbi:MAG: hypothetical protein NZ744_13225 [Pirellulaceae bacterium]|nr:hypothetical protein [Pirellulaceae bacterium]
MLCENCLEEVVVEAPVKAPIQTPAETPLQAAIVQQERQQERQQEPPAQPVPAQPVPNQPVVDPVITPTQPAPQPEIRLWDYDVTAEEIIDLEPIDDLTGFKNYTINPPPTSPAIQPVQPTTPVPTGDFELVVQWNIACQNCNTHLTVNVEDIGETVQCPDCSGPVTVTAPAKLPIPTRRRIDVSLNSDQEAASTATKIATKAVEQPAAPPPEVEYEQVIEWAVVCSVCHTAVTATPPDIDSTVACPDCFKPLYIERPNPMPAPTTRMKHGPELELNTKQPAFDLSASPDLREKIGRSPEDVDNVILKKAEQEYEQIVATENKITELSWLQMLLMIGANTDVLSRVAILAVAWIVNAGMFHLANQPGHILVIYLFSAISLLMVSVISVFAFTNLINIVRRTAYGDFDIVEWPPFDIVDWLLESLVIYVAMGTATIPAAILYGLLAAILPPSMIFIPLGLAILVTAIVFPFTMLSIFENNRFYLPFSRMLQQRIMRFPELLVKFALTSIPMIIISMLAFPAALLADGFIVKAIGVTTIWVCLTIYSRNIGIYAYSLARVSDEQTAQ